MVFCRYLECSLPANKSCSDHYKLIGKFYFTKAVLPHTICYLNIEKDHHCFQTLPPVSTDGAIAETRKYIFHCSILFIIVGIRFSVFYSVPTVPNDVHLEKKACCGPL